MKQIQRILMVMQYPFSNNFGASKVQMGLADEYRKLGYSVDFFSLDHAFSWKMHFRARISRLIGFFVPQFSFYARKFVRKVGKNYQVIDSHIGHLPFSKEQLEFSGALISRSVAFLPDYLDFERKMRSKPNSVLGVFENVFRERELAREMKDYKKAIIHSDSIIVTTMEEREQMLSLSQKKAKVWVVPIGFPENFTTELNARANPAKSRLMNPVVSFLGAWGPRKGSNDWREIILTIKKAIPKTSFHLLGTQWNKAKIAQENGPEFAGDGVVVVPHYSPSELPELLAASTVGAFPSYLEGFPISPLEQMASGIPVVSYNIPGPRDSVGKLGPNFLVPTGDIHDFAEKIVRVLSMTEFEYSKLSKKCFEIALLFTNNRVARQTLEIYQQALLKNP